jgi:signal transduction histidine kinase
MVGHDERTMSVHGQREAAPGSNVGPGRRLLGARLLRPAWVRWTLLTLGAVALVPEVIITLVVERAPAGLVWVLASAAPILVAAVVLRRHPDHPAAGWLALGGFAGSLAQLSTTLLGGLTMTDASPSVVVWTYLVDQELSLVASVSLALVIGLFADGRVRRRYEGWALSSLWLLLAVPPLVLMTAPVLALPFFVDADPLPNPLYAGIVDIPPESGAILIESLFVPVFVVSLALVLLRYRRSDAEARRPMRWLLLPAVLFAVGLATQLLIGAGEPRWLISAMWIAVGLALPVVIGLGLLQPAGIDVDRVLRQSLVYAVLWLGIAAAYVAAGAALGAAAGQALPTGWAVVVVMLAAVAFQPARRRLERLADRWVFGVRPDPADAVARLGAALADTYQVDTLLPRIESTIRDGLGLQWARVRLDASPRPEQAEAEDGLPSFAAPILLDGQPVGTIECGPKTAGRFTESDVALVHTFAQQAGLAVRNVGLTRELARQTEELAASRDQLVRAQDAERRRIERNIHDGVQQDLVALIGLAGQARQGTGRDPVAVSDDLVALQDGLRRVLGDLRELAQGIHPAVLTDRGLLEAVEALASRHPVPVTVRADPSLRGLRLIEQVEGAGYFTVAEALANSLKHANAQRVDVSLHRVNGSVVVGVRDDGVGIQPDVSRGNGLAGLSARVAAAGGRLKITSPPGEGTTVTATLRIAPRRG